MAKFHDTLKGLGFGSYVEYLNSDLWKRFKDSYRASGMSCRCVVCNSGVIQLHHHTYERLGCEQLTDVTPLCRPHHEAVHTWLKQSGRIFVKFTSEAVAALSSAKPELVAVRSSRKPVKRPEIVTPLTEARDRILRLFKIKPGGKKTLKKMRRLIREKNLLGLIEFGDAIQQAITEREQTFASSAHAEATRSKDADRKRRLAERNATYVDARGKSKKAPDPKFIPRSCPVFQLNAKADGEGGLSQWQMYLKRRWQGTR